MKEKIAAAIRETLVVQNKESIYRAVEKIMQIKNEGWVSVKDGLPEPLETVWISNGIGWTALGCKSELYEYADENGKSCFYWCWCMSNGVVYEENGKLVSECDTDDLDVQYWHRLPKPINNKTITQ